MTPVARHVADTPPWGYYKRPMPVYELDPPFDGRRFVVFFKHSDNLGPSGDDLSDFDDYSYGGLHRPTHVDDLENISAYDFDEGVLQEELVEGSEDAWAELGYELVPPYAPRSNPADERHRRRRRRAPATPTERQRLEVDLMRAGRQTQAEAVILALQEALQDSLGSEEINTWLDARRLGIASSPMELLSQLHSALEHGTRHVLDLDDDGDFEDYMRAIALLKSAEARLRELGYR